jgi:hypothetical protein
MQVMVTVLCVLIFQSSRNIPYPFDKNRRVHRKYWTTYIIIVSYPSGFIRTANQAPCFNTADPTTSVSKITLGLRRFSTDR